MEIDKDILTAHLDIIFTTLGADTELALVPVNNRMDIDNTIQQYFFSIIRCLRRLHQFE